MSGRRTFAAFATACIVAMSLSCTSSSNDTAARDALDDDRITVGSFNFAESELLGELYAQALEQAGFEVRREFGIGPRELVSPALVSGLVEVVPEYAGTALQFLSLGREAPSAAVDETHASLSTVANQRGLIALAPAPAQNTNQFVASRTAAERFHLRQLSDVGSFGRQLTFGGPPECPARPLCLGGLTSLYGISFGTVVALDAGGPMTHDALDSGYVDVALLFSTDPAIGRDGYVALDDDLHLQPAENITPLLHSEAARRFGPALSQVIDAVSVRLTTEELRRLNALQEQPGADIADVASTWLAAQGLR